MNTELRWPKFWLGIWIFGMLLGCYLSLRPGTMQQAWFPNSDKLIHASGYMLLAIVAVGIFDKTTSRINALLWLLILGGWIEIAQGLWASNRSMEFADWIADGLGIALGAWACWRFNLLRFIEQKFT